jgi:plasmid maintenance system antidote protein VapI
MSADTALRLARYLATSPDLWENLQKTYKVNLARQEFGDPLERAPQQATLSGGAT